jgi:predicted nucleic acid-binding protein
MKCFLDSSILVESCLSNSPKYAAADELVHGGHTTSAHALAEVYATLTGDARLRISPADAAAMVKDLAERLDVQPMGVAEYLEMIGSAPGKGVRGGGIYDALHAQTARLCHCAEIRTLNIGHFRHAAPGMVVRGL